MSTNERDLAQVSLPDEFHRTESGGGARSSATNNATESSAVEASATTAKPGKWVRWIALAGLLLAAFACFLTILAWQRSERVIKESARRMQEAELRVNQLESQLKQTQDQSRDSAGRSALLDSKVADVVGQQAQLERMYRNIAQNSLDSVLGDAENSISIATQQLLVGSNVPGALMALQDADTVLKRVDQSAVSVLRRLLARDIERLKALPPTDIASMAARLDAVASSIDQLPLVSGASETTPGAIADTQSADTHSAIGRITESGLRGWNSLKQELLALLRVTRIDTPDVLLLAPSQQYFVRENLRLTLLSARFALLSRNEAVFKSDLERAIKWLGSYYDKQARSVMTAGNTLKQLQASKVTLELPSLAESLTAVRSQRSTPEGRP
jgi:uroporphyrin-III C-methyltransferase